MMSISKAAKLVGMKSCTASNSVKKFQPDMGNPLPVDSPLPGKASTRSKGEPLLLKQEHTDFIVGYIEENPFSSVMDLTDALAAKSLDLSVSPTTVHEHMKEHCQLSFKQVRAETDKRNSPESKGKRKAWGEIWNSEMKMHEFYYKSVFIDECGFTSGLAPLYGWSLKGRSIKKPVSSKEFNITIIGAITHFGVLSLTARVPQTSKDKPLPKKPIDVPGGTTSLHFYQFMEALLDQLDSLGQSRKGINLVMDNCQIHHGPAVQELCIARGYNIVFLPPYSPFLNPIEEFWSKLKLVYRHDKLDDAGKDGVVHRVNEAVSKRTWSPGSTILSLFSNVVLTKRTFSSN